MVIDGDVNENFYCCKTLTETIKDEDIFKDLDEHLQLEKLSWKNCIGISTSRY